MLSSLIPSRMVLNCEIEIFMPCHDKLNPFLIKQVLTKLVWSRRLDWLNYRLRVRFGP